MDTNVNTPTALTSYTVLGGPLAGAYTTPFFTARANSAFGFITNLFSGSTSNYQALSLEIRHHKTHRLEFVAGYTWSHSLDNVSSSSNAPSNLLVPTDLRAEYSDSDYDLRHRFFTDATIDTPWQRKDWLRYFTDGWRLSVLYRVASGQPFSLNTSGMPDGGLGSSVNGSGRAPRIDAIGRNTFRLPVTWTADLRLSRASLLRNQ